MICSLAGGLPQGGSSVQTTPADIAAQFNRENPILRALLAERSGKAVGVCIWFPYYSTWKGAGIYVQDLFVEETERGTGLGMRLLCAVIAAARAEGTSLVRLCVDAANERALSFYQRLGFTEDHTDRMFTLFGEDFDRLAGRSFTDE